jgi:hypothetical protein
MCRESRAPAAGSRSSPSGGRRVAGRRCGKRDHADPHGRVDVRGSDTAVPGDTAGRADRMARGAQRCRGRAGGGATAPTSLASLDAGRAGPRGRRLTQRGRRAVHSTPGRSADAIPHPVAAVGYESEAAFSRAFKRATGEAPAAWRRARQRDPSQALKRPGEQEVG